MDISVGKEVIQYIYQKFKSENYNDTDKCLSFLKYLHEEKKDLHFLKGMEGLTVVEEQYIDRLLNN